MAHPRQQAREEIEKLERKKTRRNEGKKGKWIKQNRGKIKESRKKKIRGRDERK